MNGLVFNVHQEAYGGYYTRAADPEKAIITEGTTWDELRANVLEAVEAWYGATSAKPETVILNLVHSEELLAAQAATRCLAPSAVQPLRLYSKEQSWQHIILSPSNDAGHLTVPEHNPIRTGTFATILLGFERLTGIWRDELLQRL